LASATEPRDRKDRRVAPRMLFRASTRPTRAAWRRSAMKKKLSLFTATFVLAAAATYATSAQAWWQRVPGAACAIVQAENSQYGLNGPGNGGILNLSVYSSNLNTNVHAYCPFVDSDLTPDNTISGITVDLAGTSCAQPGHTLGANACVFSGWT